MREAKYADVLRSHSGITLLDGGLRLLGGGRVRVGDTGHQAQKVIIAMDLTGGPTDPGA